jgi:hypothetical protein
MTWHKILFTLCFIVGSVSFAAAPRGLAPTAKRLTQSEIAAAGLADHTDHPEGYYVSEDGDLSLRITKSGFLKADFGVMLTNGTKANLDFPRKLRFIEEEEVYRTRGEVALSWFTTIGYLTCRYPVTFEFEDLDKGDKIRLRATIPQTMGLDAYGRCLSFGSRYINVRFARE